MPELDSGFLFFYPCSYHCNALYEHQLSAFTALIICNAKPTLSVPAGSLYSPILILDEISLVHVPTPQRGELLLWLLCQLQWQSERQVSKGNARGATDTDGCFRAQPGTACSPPSFSGNSRHACLSSFVCAKNILVWCWFESTLQMCAKFAIMIFLTVLKKKKKKLYGC